jgi:hypothetical protein
MAPAAMAVLVAGLAVYSVPSPIVWAVVGGVGVIACLALRRATPKASVQLDLSERHKGDESVETR